MDPLKKVRGRFAYTVMRWVGTSNASTSRSANHVEIEPYRNANVLRSAWLCLYMLKDWEVGPQSWVACDQPATTLSRCTARGMGWAGGRG